MNWIAIVAAVVANVLVGYLWFSNALFLKAWVALRPDKTPFSGKASPMLFVITIAAAFVSAITLDWILGLAHATSLAGGAIIGLYAGIGLVAPAFLADNLYNERPFKLYLIVTGFPVVGLLVMGAILGALGA